MTERDSWLHPSTCVHALCATLVALCAAPGPGHAAPDDPASTVDAANPAKAADPAGAEPAPEVTPPGPMPVPADLPDPARFVVVELHEEVSLGMASFVKRVAGSLGDGDVLVLDINTFGGRVDAAVNIRDALLGLREHGAKTVAYVHPRAISAGALISLATDVIVVAPGATIGAATPVRAGAGGEMEPVEEKTVSYMRQEMRATAEARGRSGDIAEAMVDADRVVPGLSDQGKLLTLDGNRALSWGIASVEAATLDALLAGLGYGDGDGQRAYTVERVAWSWAEEVAAFLTSSMVSGLLMSLGMLGLLIGLYTGGSPVPLITGGLCLAMFFFGHHVVDLAGVEEMVIFAVGVVLILVEVFVPGHIVPGVLGALLVVASLVMGLVELDSVPFTVQWHEGWILRAFGTVFGAIAGAAVLGIGAFHVLPATRLGRALLLETAVEGGAADGAAVQNPAMIGQIGVAASDLRPSGKVVVAGKRYDAVAERGFIGAGNEIRVRKAHGFSLVVAEVKPTAVPTESTESAAPESAAPGSAASMDAGNPSRPADGEEPA